MKSVILKVFGVTPEQWAALGKLSASSVVRYRDVLGSGCYEKGLRLVTLKNPKEGHVGEGDVPTLNLEIEVSVITYAEPGHKMLTTSDILRRINQILGIFPEQSTIVCTSCHTPTLEWRLGSGVKCTVCELNHDISKERWAELSQTEIEPADVIDDSEAGTSPAPQAADTCPNCGAKMQYSCGNYSCRSCGHGV